jgi:lactate dehydrogenase-like 2-hydroxyacid dehydrogenase
LDKIDLLINLKMEPLCIEHLAEHYSVHYWPDPATHDVLLKDSVLKKIRAVQTNGSYGLKRPFIDVMPNLEIICAIGAGFEGIDLDAARERGIPVTHGPGTNATAVADQAWALLLAAFRRIPWCDQSMRAGGGEETRKIMPIPTGKKLGIFGLGHIGKQIAKRGLGFDMEIGYFGRKPQQGVPYRYFDSLKALAEWCDVLSVSAPGGPETRHIVNAEIFDALGPTGFLINTARGSLVDGEALATALRGERIAGAGIDVIEGEPAVPDSFIRLQRLVMSPHTGGYAPEAVWNMISLVRDNMDAHFAGKPVLSPVPE